MNDYMGKIYVCNDHVIVVLTFNMFITNEFVKQQCERISKQLPLALALSRVTYLCSLLSNRILYIYDQSSNNKSVLYESLDKIKSHVDNYYTLRGSLDATVNIEIIDAMQCSFDELEFNNIKIFQE